MIREAVRWLQRSLREQAPRDHHDSAPELRRRQVVCAVVVIVGSVVLGLALRVPPGDDAFVWSSVGLSALWILGARASGRLHLGFVREGGRLVRPVIPGLLAGLLLAGLFCLGALIVRDLPWLGDQVRTVLAHGAHGSGLVVLAVTLLTGVAEETFFRGAVYAAVPRRPVLVTTVIYVLATAATGNVMLAFAAVLLGLVTGWQRRATGGILAPMLTHLTWSASMYWLLPVIFGV